MKNIILKVLLTLCFVLLAVVGFIIASGTSSDKTKPEKLGSIVRLVINGVTFCSGTVISEHTVLTAAHCVVSEDAPGPLGWRQNIEIRPSDNSPLNIKATVYHVRHQFDQALLVGEFDKFYVRPFISGVKNLTILRKTANMTVCGYPLNGSLYCGTFYFKSLDNFFWKGTGLLLPGMSGGAVLDSDGNLLATNVAVTEQYSIVSPTYNIRQEVEK